jgi:hypothetical protein
MLSAATALVIPSIERIGVAWTNIIAAVLALIGQGWGSEVVEVKQDRRTLTTAS